MIPRARTLSRRAAPGWIGAFAGILGLAMAASAAQAAPPCRVLDPDLQARYEGECVDGWAHGRGEASGVAEYAGAFRHGRKHGKGRLRMGNGDVYTGEFRDDQPEGLGAYLWQGDPAQRGNRYVGEFHLGKREGRGVLLTAAGDRYEGRWLADVRAGQTASEIQFQRRYQALGQAIGRGDTVCRDYPVGIAGRATLEGTVLEKHGGLLTIRPARWSGDTAPGMPVPGSLANEGIMAWRPCS